MFIDRAKQAGPLEDSGKLLRLAVGFLILLHGIGKISSGPDAIIDLLAKAGLPGVLGYLVYVGEVLAPLLMIIGVWTRLAAVIVALNMVVAIGLAHMDELWQLSKSGGWELELQGLFLFSALAIALLGAGRYSVGGVGGKWN